MLTKQNQHGRINWIDAAKGIGIIFVVLGHILSKEAIREYIFSFHMPFFFFLSGYVFNAQKYTSYWLFIRNKIYSIFIPYIFFFSLAYFALLWHGLDNDLSIPLLSFLYPSKSIINGPLWFLLCLFITENLFIFFYKLSRDKKLYLLILLILSGLIGKIMIATSTGLIWNIRVAFIAIIFFGIGFIVKQTAQQKHSGFNDKTIFILFLFSIFLSLSFGHLNGTIDMNYSEYGNIVYFFISAFSGIFSWIYISKKLGDFALLDYLGKNSLTIFALHMIIIEVFAIQTGSPSMLDSLKSVFFVLLILIPFVKIFEKYLPFLIGSKLKESAKN